MDKKILIGGAVAAGAVFFLVKRSKATVTVLKKDGSVKRVAIPSASVPGASTFSAGTVTTNAPSGASLPASLSPFESAQAEDTEGSQTMIPGNVTLQPAGVLQTLYPSQAAQLKAQNPGATISVRPTSIGPGGSSAATIAGIFNIRRHEGRKGRHYQSQRGSPSGLVSGW